MKRLSLLLFLFIGLVSCVSAPIATGMYTYHSVAPEANHQNFQLISIYLDKDFTKSDRAIIDQVIKEWNFALNGYLKIQIIFDKLDHDDKYALKSLVHKLAPTGEGILMFKLNHDHEMISGVEKEEDSSIRLAFTNGLGDSGHVFVVVGDSIGSRNLHKILLHEFGHLMGADHVQIPSLMFPYYGNKQFDCIDKLTAALVAEYRDLDLNHLNFCAIPNFK